ncbi:MAG: NAD-dependent epimerase/dehydratase family protein [Thermoanaerobaculia bacterium]|nr:NAD-dependent epimerase/dehydratase family protein [Thermoanaerobaculia bacterium]
MRAFVTGGAGFIGSHLTDRLLAEGWEVVVYDDFSTGYEVFLGGARAHDAFHLVRGDVLDAAKLTPAMEGADLVCHLQANADVRGGPLAPRRDLEQNVGATFNVLSAMRENLVPRILFSSSAAVYGEPSVFPTPESAEAVQTSVYGASKLAGEAFIQAFGEYDEIRSYIFRFVSFIGERYTHGVVFDFVKKLRANPRELEVLGDGRQKKSYLHVADGVQGMMTALSKAGARANVFNLGHDDCLNVLAVADLVCEEMGLSGVRYRTTGGTRGWKGDAPFVHLDTTRLRSLGWAPTIPIEDGIRATTRYLLAHPDLLERR